MKKTVAMLTLLFSAQTFAALNGDWTGFGNWKFRGEGEGIHCSPMTMTWVETEKSIGISRGTFDCDILVMHLGESTWSILDGKLIDSNNQEVGHYDGQNLEAYMPSPNENTTIYIKVHREANHYDYDEIWFNKTEKIYVIKARFFTGGSSQ